MGLKSGYWQVALNQKYKENMTFSTGQWMWQFAVMTLGLCNAPETFERLLESLLGSLTYNAFLVYLDHVTDVGHTFQEQFTNLQKVFLRLLKAQLKLNPEKCQLFQKKVHYLGHIISPSGVTRDPEKLEAVKNWQRLTDKHQLRSFLWLCTYYRRFIAGFADIAKPLTRLTEEKQTFECSLEAETAFKSPKGALCTAHILGYPRPGEKFIVDTNASNVGISGVLSQVQDGSKWVVV